MPAIVAFGIIFGIIILVIVANIKVVPQANAFVIERFGAYYATWHTGIHVKVPFMDRIAKRISLKEQVVDFEPQSVITRDNVSMQIDTVVYFQVTDSKLYTYGVEHPIMAIETLCATTLRNIIGELELDNTLTSRDKINDRIREILDEATDAWGIKVKPARRAACWRRRTPPRARSCWACVPSIWCWPARTIRAPSPPPWRSTR